MEILLLEMIHRLEVNFVWHLFLDHFCEEKNELTSVVESVKVRRELLPPKILEEKSRAVPVS